MRVHVNPARRNHQPRGIDLAPGRSLLPADPGDPAFCNGNVAAKCGLAGAIHDRAATNNDVVHANLPLAAAPPRPRRNLFAFDEYRLTVGRETWARGCSIPPLQRPYTNFYNTRSQAAPAAHRRIGEAEYPRWVKSADGGRSGVGRKADIRHALEQQANFPVVRGNSLKTSDLPVRACVRLPPRSSRRRREDWKGAWQRAACRAPSPARSARRTPP